MHVSVETISNLERRMVVGIPADTVDSQVESRLAEAAKNIRLKGFRAGKVPVREVKRRYGKAIRDEVIADVMRNSFFEAITKESIQPAGMPSLEPINNTPGEEFQFAATFEIFPEVSLGDLSSISVEKLTAEVTDEDVDNMIETLRKQRATYKEADRAAEEGDQVEIDYEGSKDGEAFEGGSASGSKLVLGSGQMIDGFEDAIVGMKPGETKEVSLTFPEDYHAENLKGQDVVFKITLNKVFDQELPEIDKAFMESFGVKSESIDEFKAEVRKNMERELKNAIQNKVKNQVMDSLLELHAVEVPKSLVAAEIDRERNAMIQQFGGGAGFDKSLLPDEIFADKAEKTVALSLVVNQVVKDKELKADPDKVKAFIEEIAESYEQPEEVVNWYYGNQEQLQQVESMMLEQEVIDHILDQATVTEKAVSYEEAVKPEAPQA